MQNTESLANRNPDEPSVMLRVEGLPLENDQAPEICSFECKSPGQRVKAQPSLLLLKIFSVLSSISCFLRFGIIAASGGRARFGFPVKYIR